ncbi:hypothetical protein K435DRAFT_777434 [Dendrothele bispora CBS 962.96]|uniref:SMODS and SLOG-associating 2TM effector domain-containing protein n=1 Tax=Dendrothele bispora (strain CBS 962.96) TaxID=1314807 RepID=A0A4V4HGE6_DENBC|nr:hypothetical protein K435DRAFT_777434 [Dendrothele bispora CBS 962.96]
MDHPEGSQSRPPAPAPIAQEPQAAQATAQPQQSNPSTSPRSSGLPPSPTTGTSSNDEKQPLVDRQNSSATEVPAAPPQSFRVLSHHQGPLPPLPPPAHRDTVESGIGEFSPTRSHLHRSRSNVDWIIPTVPERPNVHRPKTFGERLEPTVTTAREERSKYEMKAKMTGYALNVAIGLQVLLGALTTGLSAVTTGHQTSIMTSILGGLSTLVASYLARARGSNEPELSITRVKDLEQFIRECEAFQMDVGHLTGNDHDDKLRSLRNRFEELLGNASGERKLSPPV